MFNTQPLQVTTYTQTHTLHSATEKWIAGFSKNISHEYCEKEMHTEQFIVAINSHRSQQDIPQAYRKIY